MRCNDSAYLEYVTNVLQEKREDYLKEKESLPAHSMFAHIARAKIETVGEITSKLNINLTKEKTSETI